MPITTRFDLATLRPNYPNDRNAAGYFSHVKSWSIRDGGIYIPPTESEFIRFTNQGNLRFGYEFTSDESRESMKRTLATVNPWQIFGVGNSDNFVRLFRDRSSASYRHRSNSTGTDALQLIQSALNMYVLCKQRLGLSAWKVDYIHSCRNELTNRQDDCFRGRCVFRLNNGTISGLIEQMHIDMPAFWQSIFVLYDSLATYNRRIAQPQYVDQPVVTRTRRNQPVAANPNPPAPPRSNWDIPPPQPIRPLVRPVEPVPTTRLATEYLSRTIEDHSIPANQLAEMLRQMGDRLSNEVRDTIYDMLMSDFNGSGV